jgi:hypothetical protein
MKNLLCLIFGHKKPIPEDFLYAAKTRPSVIPHVCRRCGVLVSVTIFSEAWYAGIEEKYWKEAEK